MKDSTYIAVDLGAGSGRVFMANLAPQQFSLHEVRRFSNQPIRGTRHLEWRAGEMLEEIKTGLRSASRLAHDTSTTVSSIGVDGWGVDYGLLDSAGELCSQPICYRDKRTEAVIPKVFDRIPRELIYGRTGIQVLVFNTLFQLAAHAQAGIPKSAVRLLLIPDLVHFFLTGKAVTEYTNATTTQMLNARTSNWDLELLERLGLPARLLAEIVPAGTELGPLKSSLSEDLGLQDVRVVAPATHDTASAVAGTPLEEGFAYISSGTWSLIGIERDQPLIDANTAQHNFTNEGGAFGTIRFLKNVIGLWIFESCRREWHTQGIDFDYSHVLQSLDVQHCSPSLIFPDDPRFLNPPSMLAAITAQLHETGQSVPVDAHAWTKLILDSLAFRYASVVRTMESLTGRSIKGIHIVGGGCQNDYLNHATANATALPVCAGPVEATVIGNVLVQAIRAGRFTCLSEARNYVATNIELKKFAPCSSSSWEEAARRYAAIEEKYANCRGAL
jgi:rhamnulokinase